MTRYFSFGQDHIHKIDGVIYDKDVIVEISAPDPRKVMFEIFGRKWSNEYTKQSLKMEYFPRGIIKIN